MKTGGYVELPIQIIAENEAALRMLPLPECRPCPPAFQQALFRTEHKMNSCLFFSLPQNCFFFCLERYIFLGIADLKYRSSAASHVEIFSYTALCPVSQSPCNFTVPPPLSLTLSTALPPLPPCGDAHRPALHGNSSKRLCGCCCCGGLRPGHLWWSGYGRPQGITRKGDLFAIARISALYSLDVAIAAIIGTVLWASGGKAYKR